MPQFTRPTIVAAGRTADRFSQASLSAFLLDHGLEDAAPESVGSVVKRVNRLIKYLLENTDAETAEGENFVDVVVRDLVQRAHDRPVQLWEAGDAFGDRFPNLARALSRDGFVIEDGQLRRMLPGALGLPDADDEIHVLLKRFGFSVPEGHLAQAIQNHTDGKWAAANSQLRSFMEALLDEIAEKIAPDPSTLPPSGHGRRTWLATTATPAFLLSPLNEWDGQGKGYFEGFFRRLHPQGSHPGLSDEEDCTFRLHTALIAARLLLRRLAARLAV